MRSIGLLLLLSCTVQTVGASWFENSEQAGKRLFDAGQFKEAAQQFKDEYRRGVALYRAGEYQAAEKSFANVQRSEVLQEARYNLGNTRFKQENYEGAILAYEEVLSEEPNHSEARHNQGLAKAMLAKTDPEALTRLEQEQKKSKQEEKSKEEKSKSEEEKEQQESQSGEQQQEQESQSGEQQQEQESQSGEQQQEQESQS
ncbi:MAG: tetratricopeptide repeat protein, partial [Gammaproteobacteria bacterium]|nr:tetratricopeptide repeat protein [Gammaproteobacteria bacterium]